MKQARMIAIITAIITSALALLFLSGCGGGGIFSKTTQNLGSVWNGSLDGVSTLPSQNETNVATDSWIEISWPDEDYPPPRQFTFQLQKEEHPDDWGAIHTTLDTEDTDALHGVWWFEPVNEFSYNTAYRIILTDTSNNDQVIIVFYTTSGRSASVQSITTQTADSVKKHRPTGKENAPLSGGEGQEIYTITTGK